MLRAGSSSLTRRNRDAEVSTRAGRAGIPGIAGQTAVRVGPLAECPVRRYPAAACPGGWLLKTAVALGASMIIISGQPGTLVSCAGVPRPRIETLHLE